MNSTLVSTSLLATQRGGLDLRVEQDVEGLTGLPVHGIGLWDVELIEECLVGCAAQRVIDAHVDRVAVTSQGQAVLQMGLGLFVLQGAGLDLCFQERQALSDPLLLSLQQLQRHGSGVVSLKELGPLRDQILPFSGVGLLLLLGGGL
ncbi:hypothetical protein HGQ17_08140 [Nesterenkonia sp. MY13]|uniref:Uncharacterized protein n=1 Tax=Nesterenkonia sedimenti TaxID=1463632 RepID=A0A7X8YE89_9MICC|nr:hypothetical protein [Nesterenkonia sedimenti]NLS09967.1 hypothetical protein [Nesterenkonia sedimenti]